MRKMLFHPRAPETKYMLLISDNIGQQPADQQRKIYAAWQQATKRGDIPALKLLTRFDLPGARGQTRAVFDYAYTEQHAAQVAEWFAAQQIAPQISGGITAQQAEQLTDEQLMALIQQAKHSTKKRPKKGKKAPKIDAVQEPENAVQDTMQEIEGMQD